MVINFINIMYRIKNRYFPDSRQTKMSQMFKEWFTKANLWYKFKIDFLYFNNGISEVGFFCSTANVLTDAMYVT